MDTPLWYIDYCKKQNAEILNEIDNKLIVFLDTKIWIKFRDYIQGKPVESQYKELYLLLKKAVDNNKCICPLIEAVYFELLKRIEQKDIIDVFKVIDELSKDLMQININQIAEFELLNFLYKVDTRLYVNKIQSQYVSFPIYSDDNASEDCILKNKQMIEYFINTKMEDLLRLGKVDISYYQDRIVNPLYYLLSQSINANEKQKYKSYYELRKYELKNSLQTLYDRYKNKYSINEDFIENALKCKNINTYMPFINNSASLYANIRWSELHNLTTNDIYDLTNFPCALGYSDVFLAETKYINRLKQKPLSEDTKTKTFIESDVTAIIRRIEELT